MQPRIWKIIAVPLITGGSISIVYSFVMMDPVRVIVSEMIVLLLGLLIVLFRRENRYLAFIITGFFIGLKLLLEVMVSYPDFELYVWTDLLGLFFTGLVGTLLLRKKMNKSVFY